MEQQTPLGELCRLELLLKMCILDDKPVKSMGTSATNAVGSCKAEAAKPAVA
jgi:hypothetical protein